MLDRRRHIVAVRFAAQAPELLCAALLARKADVATGAQFVDITEEARPRRVKRHQHIGQPFYVYLWLNQWMRQQRLEFGAEDDGATALRIKERLNTQEVARQQQFLSLFIPQSEGENAVKALQTCLVPFRVGVQQHLRIG